jgi:small-conductance mechanosensitive channel
MPTISPLSGIFGDLWADLHDPDALWQVAVLFWCLALAWLAAHGIRKPLARHSGAWRLGIGGVNRLAFPLSALTLVLVARPILAHWHHVNLLNLAVPLLLSLAGIRISVFALRQAFRSSNVLAVFERVIALFIWTWVALYLSGLIPDVVEILESLNMAVGKQRISLWVVLRAAFWVIVALLSALWIGGMVEARLLRTESMHSSLREVLSRVSKALLVLAAVMISLPLVGIDLTVLSVFGGALGVGVGFGLQKVASNYVSGFIILLDRSIRLGDMVSVGDHRGVVTNITTRYTVLQALDGTEVIVPNETLIVGTVINHSLSDRRVRLATQIQVAYGTDLDAVRPVMEDIARRHPRVVADPEPAAYLTKFADNGLELELGFWIQDPEQGRLNVISDINLGVWREFRRRGIEVPLPQREVRILRRDAT